MLSHILWFLSLCSWKKNKLFFHQFNFLVLYSLFSNKYKCQTLNTSVILDKGWWAVETPWTIMKKIQSFLLYWYIHDKVYYAVKLWWYGFLLNAAKNQPIRWFGGSLSMPPFSGCFNVGSNLTVSFLGASNQAFNCSVFLKRYQTTFLA